MLLKAAFMHKDKPKIFLGFNEMEVNIFVSVINIMLAYTECFNGFLCGKIFVNN